MEQIVTGCKDCPFGSYGFDEFFCHHPSVEDSGAHPIKKHDEDKYTPRWCPLKKEPITIIKK